MEMMTIYKSDLAAAMAKAQKAYAIVGPVNTPNGYIFQHLDKGQVPELGDAHTVLSPKASVFPQCDQLLSFNKKDPGKPVIKEISIDSLPTAIVGIRPYDAKAIAMLKKNFDTQDVTDPYFSDRHTQLTLIGLADIHPDSTDFSTDCGTGPFDEASLDILLADAGDAYLGKILTDKGRAFASAAGFSPGSDIAQQQFEALKQQTLSSITQAVDLARVGEMETLQLYDHPVWEDLAFACINCNTCTFVCPTCWCFDIQDETSKDDGVRLKLWDSCMCEMYSSHASGHNPRQEKWHRFRNRFMHKLKYFYDKYDSGAMCVGCGRCIRSCPVGIDIRTVAKTLTQAEAAL